MKAYTERQYQTYINYLDQIDSVSTEEGMELYIQMNFWLMDNNISGIVVKQMDKRHREEFLGHRPILRVV